MIAKPPVMGLTTMEQVLVLPSVPLRLRGLLPPVGALYVATIDDEYAGYVGYAKMNLRERWLQHVRIADLEKLGTVRIAFLVTNDEDSLPDAEERTIKALRPRLNYQHVPREKPVYVPQVTHWASFVETRDVFGLTNLELETLVAEGRIPFEPCIHGTRYKRVEYHFQISEVRAALDALSRPGDTRPAP